MSRYTTEVRFICESEAGLTESAGFNSVDEVLDEATPKVFNFDFPIFDETYRIPLEKKILRHFYTREIGFETVGLWKLKLQDKLCMIMPYYNKLYESELLTFNPFYDYDLKREHQRVDNGNQSNSGSSERISSNRKTSSDSRQGEDSTTTQNSGTNWSMFSDTPQGGINGVDDNTYLSNAKKDTADNAGIDNKQYSETIQGTDNNEGTENVSTQNEGTIHNIEDYAEHVIGKSGGISYSKMLKEFRDTFLNIDKMIIDDLEDLFFGLWM